jgi:pyruvate,orthophosphate dikinase
MNAGNATRGRREIPVGESAEGFVSGAGVTLSPTAWTRLRDLCLRGVCRFPDDEETSALVEAGLVKRTADGIRVLAVGIETHARASRLPEGSGARQAVEDAYQRFLPLDLELKRAITDWQLRGYSGSSHLDAEGWAIIDRVRRIHDRLSPILRRLATAVARLGDYRTRLAEALHHVEEHGEYAYLSGLTVDSYHTLWWHLHQELLWALGISRSEDPNQ